MYNIRLIIGAVAAAVVFGLGAAAGYRWESGKVEALKGELKTIQLTAQTAEQKLQSAQQEINAKLAEKDTEYKQKMDALAQEEAGKRQALQTAIAEGTKRETALKTQMGSLNAKLRDAREQQKNAPPEEKAALQAKIDELLKERSAAKQEFRGEKCLGFPVPKAVIDALNGVKS
jgi:hypothetical protein